MPRLTGSHLSQVYDFSSLERRIKRYVDDTHVRFIRGYFNESLTKALAPVLRPALFVDIDVDLYISTMQACSAHRGRVERCILHKTHISRAPRPDVPRCGCATRM